MSGQHVLLLIRSDQISKNKKCTYRKWGW